MHILAVVANIAAFASIVIAAGAAVTIAAGDETSRMPPATTAITATAALVEDDDCGQDRNLSGVRRDTTVARTGTQQLTVSVPPIAVVTYGPEGHVTSVMTNTGCAPRSDDQIWQTSIDSGLTEGTWAVIEHIDFVGNFAQAGTHVSQQPAPR